MHEHHSLNLTPSQRTVIVFDIEVYPEPKALSPTDLRSLVMQYGGYKQADVSNIERGKRGIGKTLAKRIEKEFKNDYRRFL